MLSSLAGGIIRARFSLHTTTFGPTLGGNEGPVMLTTVQAWVGRAAERASRAAHPGLNSREHDRTLVPPQCWAKCGCVQAEPGAYYTACEAAQHFAERLEKNECRGHSFFS